MPQAPNPKPPNHSQRRSHATPCPKPPTPTTKAHTTARQKPPHTQTTTAHATTHRKPPTPNHHPTSVTPMLRQNPCSNPSSTCPNHNPKWNGIHWLQHARSKIGDAWGIFVWRSWDHEIGSTWGSWDLREGEKIWEERERQLKKSKLKKKKRSENK